MEESIENLDLYELLEIEFTSSVNDIKKAYRKKALQCHPDKNPDDPEAAKKFHQLSKVLALLTDEAARAAYDRVLKGRKEAALRHKELDGKRRKLKEDLEAREKSASSGQKQKSADEKLKEEIDRLRKEGSKLVEEEINYVNQQLAKENVGTGAWDSSQHRIKIKWKASKGDNTNGGYSKEVLERIMLKHGDIEGLVMSRGSALVEFKEQSAAEQAMEFEIGLTSNPLKLNWVNPPPKVNKPHSSLIKDSDFESVTLMKMRQAEERKRLIEQMMKEDEES